MNDSQMDNLEKALKGTPFNVKALLNDRVGVMIQDRIFLPKSTSNRDVQQFQLVLEVMLKGLDGSFSSIGIDFIRKPQEAPKSEPVTSPTPEPSKAPDPLPEQPTPIPAPAKERLWYHPESSCYFRSSEDQTDGLTCDVTGIPEHEKAALEEMATPVKELGTPSAVYDPEKSLVKEKEAAPVKESVNDTPKEAAPAPKPTDATYVNDLPQSFEFLRIQLTALLQAGAEAPVLQLMINAAVDAKELGRLKEWRKVIEPGIAKTLSAGRHPGEFVPSMLTHVSKTIAKEYTDLDPEVQTTIKAIAAEVADNHKGRFLDDVDEMLKEKKGPHFAAAWEEVELAMERGGVTAPARMWRKIVNDRFDKEQTDHLRQPVKVGLREAVEWLKPWMPAFEGKLDQETIKHDTIPLARRDSAKRRVEAGYIELKDHILNRGNGVCLDALVTAWSGPEAPTLFNAWMNKLEKEYTDDGKRFGFSQQSVDICATALFLDVMRRDDQKCKDWLEVHREDLKNHPKIGELYSNAFPAVAEVEEKSEAEVHAAIEAEVEEQAEKDPNLEN